MTSMTGIKQPLQKGGIPMGIQWKYSSSTKTVNVSPAKTSLDKGWVPVVT